MLEVLENNMPVAEGEFGELVCTSLLNSDMPLIRYRVGDRGRVISGEACALWSCAAALEIVKPEVMTCW